MKLVEEIEEKILKSLLIKDPQKPQSGVIQHRKE